MPEQTTAQAHRFHIPVLGTGYTVDTPLKVAQYGITSVVSIVDDTLLEQLRAHYSHRYQLPYTAITVGEPDSRALRIMAYLNLLQTVVDQQVADLVQQPFTGTNALDRCFSLLPDGALRQGYEQMLAMADGEQRQAAEQVLRASVRPGSIDVNIMTKVDRQRWQQGAPVPAQFSDASAALRGYARSTLQSALVLSAGMNPRLFQALGEYEDFFADERGNFRKRIILKVSDFRSALTQGQVLARKGLWTSEFRIESGLNCGGHAFAAKGLLLGPILEEFHNRRHELQERLADAYSRSNAAVGRTTHEPTFIVSAQGGVGTASESEFLRRRYQLHRIGWGTPFLLVPEVVNLDHDNRQRLAAAGADEIELSEASPLGISLWNLRNSASDRRRLQRIARGQPGVLCKKKHLAFNQEFTEEPACTASRSYQRQKLNTIAQSSASEPLQARMRQAVLAKTCLCMDLAATVSGPMGFDADATAAVVAGPNIVNFSQIVSLQQMVDHIYGRANLISTTNRPHLMLRELAITIEVLAREIADSAIGYQVRELTYFAEVIANIKQGIAYYRQLFTEPDAACEHTPATLSEALEGLEAELQRTEALLEPA